ncbi:unnamed protein product [Bursaphelenchus xylophilus]|uniref:(pine wood nematode) hypothetical protein n=1 Tax=Bursaphelenchus xylophilus TaxID=6326 RepID=A0A1I7RKK9_BURXY|nr:unnamed protein product [Bursaphelenchus xylophilus]CAG9131250.1 unnamed protein product [Bursaphelenchus xylophilus]
MSEATQESSPSLISNLIGIIVAIFEFVASIIRSFTGSAAAPEPTPPTNQTQFAKSRDPNYQTLAFMSNQEPFGKDRKVK